jgi:ABC-type uncharacterized transport system permease subunit
MAAVLTPVVRLLASVPSVVYGLLGVLVVVPFIGNHLITEPQKASVAGVISLTGYSLLAAVLVLTVMLAPLVGGRPGDAWRAWRRDAGAHPSPNAGVAEATMAGALGVALGGRTEYRHGTEMRPVLGDGRTPRVPDLRRAVRLSNGVQLTAAVVAAVTAYALGRRRSARAELPE